MGFTSKNPSEVSESRAAKSRHQLDGLDGMGKRVPGSPGILGRDGGVKESGEKSSDIVDSGEARR